MVEIEHTPERVYACAVVHGAPMFLRFDNQKGYDAFVSLVGSQYSQLTLVTGYDSKDLLVRPASVDIIVKGATPE